MFNRKNKDLRTKREDYSTNILQTNKFAFWRYSDFGVTLGLIGLIVIFSAVSPVFLTSGNIITIIRQMSIIAIIAVGETIVLMNGGIDASIGSVAGLCGIISVLLVSNGFNISLSFIIALALGAFIGFFNGIIITKIGVTDFIATLAMLSIAHGINWTITRGKSIYLNIPESYTILGRGFIGAIPVPVIVMVTVYIFGGFLIARTRLGTFILASGGNREAARLSGINVDRVKIIVYMIGGILSGLGGIVLISRLGSGQPNAGSTLLLDVIAAVVLGGTSLSGGKGSLFGTFIGVAIIGVLSSGLTLLKAPYYIQEIIKGVAIILAVSYTSYRELRTSKR